MTTRIMFYLVLVVLFVFAGNSFAMEDTEEPSKIDTTEEYDEIIGPQGTEATYNTFYGNNAGYTLLTSSPAVPGESNTFIGSQAGFSDAVGWGNTFVGRDAGYNTTSGGNTFIGYYAGYLNTGAEGNTFVGANAGKNNTSSYNHFFGTEAGISNTTGNCNSFFGWKVGFSNTAGGGNSFFGWRAGYSNIDGGSNSFFGYDAGKSNTTGYDNSFFGRNAGDKNINGFGNVFIGFSAGYNETGSNKLYIANSNTETPLIWGDFETRNIIIHGGFRAIATSVMSDKRWKKNIQPLDSSLDKISSLQGVTYEWRTDEHPDYGFTENKQIGLIAQDVEAVLPELVSEDHDGYKAVSYAKLTAVLVEAVKELKSENQSQKKLMKEQQHQFEKQLGKQQAEIEELRSMLKELKS